MSASCSLFHLEPSNDPQMRVWILPCGKHHTNMHKYTLHGNPLPEKKIRGVCVWGLEWWGVGFAAVVRHTCSDCQTCATAWKSSSLRAAAIVAVLPFREN